MKNKKLIIINICLVLIILIFLFIYLRRDSDSQLQGSYQSKNSHPVIQLVIDDNKFTEYVDSKLTDTGRISKSEENAYTLDNGKQKQFLYKDGKKIVYFNPNLDKAVIILEKSLETPTYISNE